MAARAYSAAGSTIADVHLSVGAVWSAGIGGIRIAQYFIGLASRPALTRRANFALAADIAAAAAVGIVRLGTRAIRIARIGVGGRIAKRLLGPAGWSLLGGGAYLVVIALTAV